MVLVQLSSEKDGNQTFCWVISGISSLSMLPILMSSIHEMRSSMNRTEVYSALIQSNCFPMVMDESDYFGYLKVPSVRQLPSKKRSLYPVTQGKNVMFT